MGMARRGGIGLLRRDRLGGGSGGKVMRVEEDTWREVRGGFSGECDTRGSGNDLYHGDIHYPSRDMLFREVSWGESGIK